MPCHYEKRCFDVDVIGKRTECDRFSSEGKQNLLCSFKKIITNLSIVLIEGS